MAESIITRTIYKTRLRDKNCLRYPSCSVQSNQLGHVERGVCATHHVRPSQTNWVMSSAVNLPITTHLLGRLSPLNISKGIKVIVRMRFWLQGR